MVSIGEIPQIEAVPVYAQVDFGCNIDNSMIFVLTAQYECGRTLHSLSTYFE